MVLVSAIHQHESVIGIHLSLEPPSRLPPHPTPLGWLRESEWGREPAGIRAGAAECSPRAGCSLALSSWGPTSYWGPRSEGGLVQSSHRLGGKD